MPTLDVVMTVIGTTPLSDIGIALDKLPAPVQAVTAGDFLRSGALDVSALLNDRLTAVHLNNVQGNPYQADLNYRGYTASPLLGTPQGLSVFMDGVRLNQPFGDVVSWDAIPRLAIESLALMPGSNPLFGLNTLGGALSIRTKDGRSAPGTVVQPILGGYFRRGIEIEHGGSSANGLDWYLTGNLFGDEGWREASPSDVRQVFGKAGWRRLTTDLHATVAIARNSLTGNGLQEERLLARDYRSIYTKPDTTDHRSTFVNVSGRHSPNARLTLSGNAYYRGIRTSSLNGDVNEDALDEAPGETPNGLLNRAWTEQRNAGAAAQFTLVDSPAGERNQLTAGAAYDRSRVEFQQSAELGSLTPDRGVVGLGAFDDLVALGGHIHTWSVWATDTRALGRRWHVTLSGRYDQTVIDNRDRINPGAGPESLDGHLSFGRFNPSAGLTFSPTSRVNGYLSYSEAGRAPTSIELGCANPDQPCKLPNAMAGDPPLGQVHTGTWEAGLRSGTAAGVSWHGGWFRADNRDDILFVASTQTGFGYFRNFGRTRRQGLELGVQGRWGRARISGGYTFLHATYESTETVSGNSNSSNDEAALGRPGLEGTIEIERSDRIPLIPQHTAKASMDLEVSRLVSIDLDVLGVSGSYARGNENNEHAPDGTYYLGPGRAAGYVVVNLGARYRATPRVQLLARIDNLFNRRYATAAQLGPTAFTSEAMFLARPLPAIDGEYPLRHATFYAPGPPITAWGGLRIAF